MDNNECMGHEAEVTGFTESLREQWVQLLEKIEEKTQKLREANQQQQFNEAVNDMDFWLGEASHNATLKFQSFLLSSLTLLILSSIKSLHV